MEPCAPTRCAALTVLASSKAISLRLPPPSGKSVTWIPNDGSTALPALPKPSSLFPRQDRQAKPNRRGTHVLCMWSRPCAVLTDGRRVLSALWLCRSSAKLAQKIDVGVRGNSPWLPPNRDRRPGDVSATNVGRAAAVTSRQLHRSCLIFINDNSAITTDYYTVITCTLPFVRSEH